MVKREKTMSNSKTKLIITKSDYNQHITISLFNLLKDVNDNMERERIRSNLKQKMESEFQIV